MNIPSSVCVLSALFPASVVQSGCGGVAAKEMCSKTQMRPHNCSNFIVNELILKVRLVSAYRLNRCRHCPSTNRPPAPRLRGRPARARTEHGRGLLPGVCRFHAAKERAVADDDAGADHVGDVLAVFLQPRSARIRRRRPRFHFVRVRNAGLEAFAAFCFPRSIST